MSKRPPRSSVCRVVALAGLVSSIRSAVGGVLTAGLPLLAGLVPASICAGVGLAVVLVGALVLTLTQRVPAPWPAPAPEVESPMLPHKDSATRPGGEEMSVFGGAPLDPKHVSTADAGQQQYWTPEDAKAGVGDDDPQVEPGVRGLNLEFLDNLDMRRLRFRLSYRPKDREPGVGYYLYPARLDPTQLEWVPAQQVGAYPSAYGWPAGAQPRLCQPGLLLDAQRPSCEGVLRVAAQRTGKHTTSTALSFYAATQRPGGLPGEVDAIAQRPGTLRARRSLALKEVFFVAFSSLGFVGSALYMVQRDPLFPGAWIKSYLRAQGTGQALSLPWQRLDHMELSRDGSRLYLSTPRRVFEWLGDTGTPPRLLLQAAGGYWLSGLDTIDHRVCVVEGNGRFSAALRCSSQNSSRWDPPRLIPHSVQGAAPHLFEPYSIAASGNSLLIVDQQWRVTGALPAVWVPDATLPLPSMHELTLAQAEQHPGRAILGAIAVSPRGQSPQQFLLHGFFSGSATSLAVVQVFPGGPAGGPREVRVGQGFSPRESLVRAVETSHVWALAGTDQIRLFSAAPDIVSDHYDRRRGRALSHAALDFPSAWDRHGAFNLLEHDDGSRTLVAGGALRQGVEPVRVGLLLQALPSFTGLPRGLSYVIDFGHDLAQLPPGPTAEYFVQYVTRNALLLTPCHPRPSPSV